MDLDKYENRVLMYLRKPLRSKISYEYPHYVGLGSNLHDKDFISAEDNNITTCDPIYLREFPFCCTFPLPILPIKYIPKSCLYGIDPGLEIVLKKSRWKNAVKKEIASFLHFQGFKDMKVMEGELKKNKRNANLPHYVILLAKILELDPDNQFDGFYNWYYSGGCLNQIQLQGKRILLRSSGKASNSLEAIQLSRPKDKKLYTKPNRKKKVNYEIDNGQPIFQIAVREENGQLAVRQKCKCFIFSLTNSSKSLKLTKLNEISSKFHFTSIDFDKHNEGKYVTMNTKSQVFFRDINRGKTILQKIQVPDCSNNFTDKWCSAIYGQNNDTIICSNRHFIRTYDQRARKMNCMEFGRSYFSEITETCEDITCVTEGSRKCSHPLIYVATQHHLLAMDLRFPRAFVQRWSHGMCHSPTYICSTVLDSATFQDQQEIIFLRSQISNQLHVIINTFGRINNFDKPFSDVFPFSIPSYCDTLKLAQWHGRILDPMVQNRLSNITVGMCCFEGEKDHVVCMSQNSVGDLFQQHLVPKNKNAIVEIKDVISYIDKWVEGKVRKTPLKNLEVVLRTDMKNLFEKVSNNTNVIVPTRKYKSSENWRISKTRLMRYDDMLAQKILEPWGNMDEWKEVDNPDQVDNPSYECDLEGTLTSTQEPTEKVRQWLTDNNLFSSTPIAVPTSPKNIQESNAAQLLSSQFCDSVPSPEAAKKTAVIKRKSSILNPTLSKKKRFVDGF